LNLQSTNRQAFSCVDVGIASYFIITIIWIGDESRIILSSWKHLISPEHLQQNKLAIGKLKLNNIEEFL